MSAYIKQVLFADGEASLRRLPRQAAGDPVKLAQVLAILGGTQIGPHLTALAKAAASGSLHIDELTVRRLNDACDDVRSMHLLLMEALGKRVSHYPRPKERLSVTFARAAFDPQAPRQPSTDREEF